MLIAYFVRSQERAEVFDFMMTTEFGEHQFVGGSYMEQENLYNLL